MMKKLLAILAACSMITFAMAGCGDKKSDDDEKESSSSSSVSESSEDESEEESSKDESSEEESSDEESSDEESSEAGLSGEESSDSSSAASGPSIVEAGQVDPAVLGDWYSEDLGGSFCFDDKNVVSMGMDYSSIMYFNADKELVMPDSSGTEISVPVDYDGSTLSVSYSDDTEGASMELMTLVRTDAANPDSLDGNYELIDGELYDSLITALFSDTDTTISMAVSGENLYIKMTVCEYTADGEKLEMFGDGLSLFGIASQEEAVLDYTVSGDSLSMTDASGESMDFTKVTY